MGRRSRVEGPERIGKKHTAGPSARTLLSTLRTPCSRSPVARLAAYSWVLGLLVTAHISRSECRRL